MIYSKFVVDMFYSADSECSIKMFFQFCIFSASTYLIYFLIRLVDPSIVFKNLIFFIAWPNFNMSTLRCWIVFFIALDRVLAVLMPIFYHNHRSKVPFLAVLLFCFAYMAFEYYILFVICVYEVDIPLECTIFRCAVGSCYHNYWKWYQQVLLFEISLILRKGI
uniref:G_PROTEIN_RECEP_F1_2 domain-containing protein n=1 Tax=Caenorhabditis tropicalis TaxID=1561998 RepID=A0A1I7T637_9PELO